ncbi:FAD binding domain-containing protein [Salipiger mucosus]|uniref:Carbon monoxide dehydrogenase medium chain n=1 Tax=Salipiger mucosus DSM 16094 TaxID=1123237 RepID=S9Q907_9RHOB|nr:FAD binding domain-containing protein [Salipiger mucosus]EPX76482.1 Carbon monoxide dehydrogenase medium chain [Salipiger mucosus DSM 16094]
MHEFEYLRPKTLVELRRALDRGAVILAGGQTLLPELKSRSRSIGALADAKAVLPEGIYLDAGRLIIGGAATHAEIASNDTVCAETPALAQLADQVGDPSVRNRGTLGGALASNHPAGDWPAAALALDAVLHTDGGNVPFKAIAAGSEDLAGRIILEVSFALAEDCAYSKFLHPAARYAVVGVFVALGSDDRRVAVTGLAKSGAFEWADAGTCDAPLSIRPGHQAIREDQLASEAYRHALTRELLREAEAMLGTDGPRAVSIAQGQPMSRAISQHV